MLLVIARAREKKATAMEDTALSSFRQYGLSITLSLAVGFLCIVVFFAGFRSGARLLPDLSNGYVEPLFTRFLLQMFILLLGV